MPATTTESRSYPAFFFKQRRNSPIQIAFVAPSSEIDSWARVPTKRTGNIRNFQRAEIRSHVLEVERFFQDEENASPTAVVIGFDPIRSENSVRLVKEGGEELKPDEIEPGSTITGRVEVSWIHDSDPQSSEELLN